MPALVIEFIGEIIRSKTTDKNTPIIVHEKSFACDGGGAALGHPRIYLKITQDGSAECSYCDRIYQYQKAAL